MALLPYGMNILPPSDDRIFKRILSSPEAKPALLDLITAVLNRPVIDVIIRNSELPIEDVDEKPERLDLNCVIDDGTQIDLEMQASRMKEDRGCQRKNLIGKGVYYLCDLHSSQSSLGAKYEDLVRTYQVTFCSYSVFPGKGGFINSFSLRNDMDGSLLSDALNAVYVELSKLVES